MTPIGQAHIPLADIDVTDRLRAIDEAHARLLAENIRQTGRLRQPIEVRKLAGGGYKLIAGGHRYRAMQILGHPEIEAFIFECADDAARLAEIDENLVRHDLNPLDRAVFLAERKALWERLYPQTKAGVAGGKARAGAATDIMSFARDTAERCGLTDRTIRRSVMIAARLSPATRARIAGTGLAKHQAELLALAKLGPALQAEVLDLLLADAPRAKTVKGAAEIAQGVRKVEKSKDVKQFEALQAAWLRTSFKGARMFLEWLEDRGDLRPFGLTAKAED